MEVGVGSAFERSPGNYEETARYKQCLKERGFFQRYGGFVKKEGTI